MITAEIYAHVVSAVRLLIQDASEQNSVAPEAVALEDVYKQLWPYVTHAVAEVNPSAPLTAALNGEPKRDGRAKLWQYVVRFWLREPFDTRLIAETEVEAMQGTGELPAIVARYALEMHEQIPPELSEEVVKGKLPQLRNNLGRQGSAVLRIEYTVGDDAFLCQVDVAKPSA